MGCSPSSNRIAAIDNAAFSPDYANKIQDTKNVKKNKKEQFAKILLLGVGGVGKSTVFKQAKLLYTNGFDSSELDRAHQLIVMQMIRTLTNVLWNGSKVNFLNLDDDLKSYMHQLEIIPATTNTKDESFMKLCRSCIIPAWDRPDVKAANTKLRDRKESTLLDHDEDWGNFFLDRAREILETSFSPSSEDMLKLRRETFSPQEVTFKFGDYNIKIVDVGGQQKHRDQWISEMEGVSAVIYMSSLADFDQNVPMDEAGVSQNKNALQHSFEIFEKAILKEPKFEGVPIVVLLNKSDILKEKIKKSSFKCYYPECDEDEQHSYEFATTCIKLDYENSVHSPSVATYCTNATDSELIAQIFIRIFDGFKELSLEKSGLGG